MSINARLAMTNENCIGCFQAEEDFCTLIDDHDVARLLVKVRCRKVKRGRIALNTDETSKYFLNVVSGVLKLVKSRKDGRQQIVTLLYPADIFFSSPLTDETDYVEAATDAEICFLPVDDVGNLQKKYPKIEKLLFKRTIEELNKAREWMFLLGRKTAEERVASFLLQLSVRQTPHVRAQGDFQGKSLVVLPLTRTETADFLGLTFETVSRQFSQMKELGVIETLENRRARILDMTLLRRMSGDDFR